jgi:hypothetical protein
MKSAGLYVIAGLGLVALAGIGVVRIGLEVPGRIERLASERRDPNAARSPGMGRINERFEQASRQMPALILDAIEKNQAIVLDTARGSDDALMRALENAGFVRPIANGRYERSYQVVPEAALVLAVLAGQHVRSTEPSGLSQEVQRMWRQL